MGGEGEPGQHSLVHRNGKTGVVWPAGRLPTPNRPSVPFAIPSSAARSGQGFILLFSNPVEEKSPPRRWGLTGQGDVDQLVQAAGAHQGGVNDVGPVEIRRGGRHDVVSRGV